MCLRYGSLVSFHNLNYDRCLVNMADVSQPRPDSGLGFQGEVVMPFQVVPSSLGSSCSSDPTLASLSLSLARARALALSLPPSLSLFLSLYISLSLSLTSNHTINQATTDLGIMAMFQNATKCSFSKCHIFCFENRHTNNRPFLRCARVCSTAKLRQSPYGLLFS